MSLLSLLLDVPHVLKTCQARFSNCYFQLNNKRGYFSTFYILRNRADHDVKKNVQSTLKSNDYVLNRDGQNPTGVLAICNSELLTDIATLGSLILSFMVLYLYSIIFVKLLSYRSLFLTKHFVEILTILWTFWLYEILLISMEKTGKCFIKSQQISVIKSSQNCI